MEIINGVDRLPAEINSLNLALGNFDGVHRGHQAIIKSAIKESKNSGGSSAALVFDPHPLIALRSDNQPALLTDLADRAEIFGELGLDYMIIQPFDSRFSQLSPEQFIRLVLIEKLRVNSVHVGADYTFGRKGAGSSDTLLFWGEKLNFKVHIQPMLLYNSKEVSSSTIRSLLLSGSVSEASDLLGYYFFRQGKIIKGHGVGKTLVYPTANIAANGRMIWPGKGVYLTAVTKLEEELLFGVTNVGSRPTFSDHKTAVETHIIDYRKEIYHQEIRLCFLEKLRNTKTFETPSELRKQIFQDIETSRSLIKQFKESYNGRWQSLQVGCSVLRSY